MDVKVYEPYVVGVTMGHYGYWIVELSVSPWQRMSVMVCTLGISPDAACAIALGATPVALGRKTD
jgi:hypothetical protein